ncbi:MAG: glycosyltransferase family 9 protein [Actinomycetota bacterium]|nr:glycosyltransferase family 9 protein [Actinomycetota bacterium]PLS74800.1 MAG: glycosyl transferase [Actinomycetota bacterium]
MTASTLEPVDRIAVLRANGLGDFVFSLPALTALRLTYPAAQITLLGVAHHAQLLHARPSPVDQVEVVPPYPGVSVPESHGQDEAEMASFMARMQAARFDLALQLHGGGANSNAFVQRLGALTTAGLRAPGAPALDRWVRYEYFHPEVLRYLEVVGLVGADTPPSLEPQLAVVQRDRDEATGALGAEASCLAVLHPGASDPRRRWPAPQFSKVGDELARRGLDVAVVGDLAEKRLVDAVISGMTAPALGLAGSLSLGGLLGVLERADVVVGNDSGPLHLAAAVGTATVGIYWCGNMVNGGPLTVHRHRAAVSWELDCPVCGLNCMKGRCDHDHSFVGSVPADEVLAAVDDVLPVCGERERSFG